MRFPNSKIVESLREKYPAGTRVKLVSMDDVQAPRIGSFGTVTGVDDCGSLLMSWDEGGSLNVIYGVDTVLKVVVTTICYGQKQEWTSRSEAKDYFMKAIVGCDPASSECSRYTKIYAELVQGKKLCTDEEQNCGHDS